jgi:hypothetical protein
MVAAEEMSPDLFQQIAVLVDKAAAYFALQMEMFPALPVAADILVAGAFTVAGGIFADLPPGRKFFKVAVDGGLPDGFVPIGKMPRYLVDRYMAASQGLHVVEDALSLPGMIICRTPLSHNDVLYQIDPLLSI